MPDSIQTLPVPARAPFPVVRMLYAIGFAIVASIVLWVLTALAVVQFIVFAVNGHSNEELKHISGRLAHYLWDVVSFIVFVRDRPPFPFGPLSES